MTRTLSLTLLAVALAAGSGFAQQGSIGIFADNMGLNCNLTDAGPGLAVYYIVHVYTTGSTACQFSAPKPACFTATYVTDIYPFPVVFGDSQHGVALGYGSCRIGPILVASIHYITNGQTPPCCFYPVLPDPSAASGRIETVDCNFEPGFATGGTGIVHFGLTCNCHVPAQETTWGELKALYVE